MTTTEELLRLRAGAFSRDGNYVRAADGELYMALHDLYATRRMPETNALTGVASLCGGCDLCTDCLRKGFRCVSGGRWKRVDVRIYANGLTELKL